MWYRIVNVVWWLGIHEYETTATEYASKLIVAGAINGAIATCLIDRTPVDHKSKGDERQLREVGRLHLIRPFTARIVDLQSDFAPKNISWLRRLYIWRPPASSCDLYFFFRICTLLFVFRSDLWLDRLQHAVLSVSCLGLSLRTICAYRIGISQVLIFDRRHAVLNSHFDTRRGSLLHNVVTTQRNISSFTSTRGIGPFPSGERDQLVRSSRRRPSCE
jgi:hypothetical protein